MHHFAILLGKTSMKWLDVFLNPYRRMKKDFSFLERAGFIFDYASKHNIRPAVVFKRGEESICVCFDYEIGHFEVTYHRNCDDLLGNSMLSVNWDNGLKKEYKSQFPYVQGFLRRNRNMN